MKSIRIILIVLISVSFLISISFAAIVYEKENNTLKITQTSEVVTEQIKSLVELKTEKLRLEEEIIQAAEAYAEKDSKLKADLALVEKSIIEANKLGITEDLEEKK